MNASSSPQHESEGQRDELVVTDQIRVPHSEFDWTFSRSSGPGGQNVNKLNTKAHLRWPVQHSSSLNEAVKNRFLKKFRQRITTNGDLVLNSQRYRDQARNMADCLEKLRAMLSEVAQPPRRRKPTRPTRASKERRLSAKKEQSAKKRLRRRPNWD